MESREVFQRAVDAIGEAELQKRLGFNLATAARQFARWKSGRGAPNFQHTLTLLAAAGLLRSDEEVAQLEALVAELAELRAELESVRRHRDPA